MFSFKKGFLAFVLFTAVLALGRVVMSFAFVATAVGFGLSQIGSPAPGGGTGASGIVGGIESFAHMVTSSPGRTQTFSVLDVPSEIEARRKARGVQFTGGGSMIVAIGE